MADFVPTIASMQAAPPYRFPGAKVRSFFWEPRMDLVQAWCDAFLNIGDLADIGIRYEPLAIWPYAAISIIDYPVMNCADPRVRTHSGRPPAQCCYVSQREMLVAIPLLRRGLTLRRMAFDTMIEWAVPFIVVDNVGSADCGREMLGLQKLVGHFDLADEAPTQPFTCAVDMLGWREASGAQSPNQWFFHVQAGPALPGALGVPYETTPLSLLRSRAASRSIESLAFARDFLDDTLNGLLPGSSQMVALKQVRSAADPNKALYQALVGYRTKFSDIQDFKVYAPGDISLTFNKMGSFQLILQEVFGDTLTGAPAPARVALTAGDNPASLPTLGGCEFTARIDLDQMRTMHTFPNDERPDSQRPPDDWMVPWLRPLEGLAGLRGATA